MESIEWAKAMKGVSASSPLQEGSHGQQHFTIHICSPQNIFYAHSLLSNLIPTFLYYNGF